QKQPGRFHIPTAQEVSSLIEEATYLHHLAFQQHLLYSFIAMTYSEDSGGITGTGMESKQLRRSVSFYSIAMILGLWLWGFWQFLWVIADYVLLDS
ncbi:MAG: hypothetical protein L6R35_006294, partial [Caloplaca aegaea]